MTMNQQMIPAGQFKAQCLGLMEQIQETQQPIVVTKRGVPMVTIMPYQNQTTPKQGLFGALKDTITIHEDIVAPINEHWDADKQS
jgi:prevent-host-death family protein